MLEKYRELRRSTPGEVGILIPVSTDPILARHLGAIDRLVMDDRAKKLEEQQDEIAAKAKGTK